MVVADGLAPALGTKASATTMLTRLSPECNLINHAEWLSLFIKLTLNRGREIDKHWVSLLFWFLIGMIHNSVSDAMKVNHYGGVIMGAISSQITSLTTVYSTVYSDADQNNIKAPRHWPLCGEFTGGRWIPRINGQLRGKCFHLMTSSYDGCGDCNVTVIDRIIRILLYSYDMKMPCGRHQ